jgi:hypothetical protein
MLLRSKKGARCEAAQRTLNGTGASLGMVTPSAAAPTPPGLASLGIFH